MTILFCYGVVTVISGVTAWLIGSVVWYALANVSALDDEDDEPIEDDPADWDRARERWMDREVGVW